MRGIKRFRITLWLVVIASFHWALGQSTTAPGTQPSTQPWTQVGTIDAPEIPESSGIVESRRYPGVFWTHNDSGNPPEIFAITRQGKLINRFSIRATNVDWEDIAIDDSGHLYLADIGNNNHNRTQVQVYRVSEPDPRVRGNALVPDQTFQLRYPGRPFDAESLFFVGDDAYIIEKDLTFRAPGVYRFHLKAAGAIQTLEKVMDLPWFTPVTAGDVSRDQKYFAIMSLTGPAIFQIDGDIANLKRGPIWTAGLVDANIEAVTFVSDGLLGTTEGRRVIFFPFKPRM